MTAALAWLWGKAKDFAIWIGIAVALLVTIVVEARRAGAYKERLAQREKTDAMREKWDEVDRERVDFDASLGRLRDRSKR
ncbi:MULTISPECIES: hypothetical protein [Chelatococcus]|uniref:Uncharacterized protein n=1 Tax=Chelatococcus caeni TaxID=1348468 RepID=A0A840BYD2_9HYPH|nr:MULTISPECIES: hypothetical protein [Chelatococcus]ALA16073.1 hypothetical protein AL346_00030 [Chelatococcus sp. CO-6]ALA19358.1 hypothetical protein AL346_20490 [Chelatococcus sp. CO-6]MBB4017573.1 hypothetical protein [Chelatococcus caeni]